MVTAGEEAEETLLGGGPATALTVNMKKVINVMLQKCSEGMKETFFETCVANTAHDLSKGEEEITGRKNRSSMWGVIYLRNLRKYSDGLSCGV